MEYIDKSKNRQRAHKLIQDFLQQCLKDNHGVLPKNLYETFRSYTDFKNQFVNILLSDNHHRCCYCMRDIIGTTLEHMIPQDVNNQDDYDQYFVLNSHLDRNNMILAKDFPNEPHQIPPFPHTLAYENLIPSCFGAIPSAPAKCCNNFRGNKMVHPLVFRPNIHNEVIYKTNGNIIWTEDPETLIPTISKLGLDCLELKAIRRIWCYLSEHRITCDDANRFQVIDDLLIALGEPKNRQEKDMQQMLNNFKNQNYWNILKKYAYFHSIQFCE